MERFAIIVNGFRPLTIITKRSILDVAAALDPTLLLWYPRFVLVTIIWIDMCLVFLNLKMKVRNENYTHVNIEDILFKINKVIVL